MPFAHRIVRESLSPYVETLWLSEGYTQSHRRERVLPTGRMDLVIPLDDANETGQLSGAHSTAFVLDTSKPLSVIGVRFKPGGGAAFIGLPAGELQDQSVALDDLWCGGAPRLRDALFEATDPQAKLHALEQFLLARLTRRQRSAVDYALAQFQHAPGATSVGQIVGRTGLSPRRFIAAFRDRVGLTPKLFVRLCRFRRLIDALQGQAEVDWADAAVAGGYFDQSHLIRDFHEFTGMRPAVYLRNRTGSLNHVRCPD